MPETILVAQLRSDRRFSLAEWRSSLTLKSQSLRLLPMNDPYLIGVARAVDESLARDHVDPGQLLRAVVGDFKSQRMHKHR